MQDPHQTADPADKSLDRSGSIAAEPSGRDAPALRRIFVVGDDPGFADELKSQLSYFGYDISIFNTASALMHALQQTPDSIVLMDTTFQEDRLGGVKLMDEIQQGRDVAVPVVFLSACAEFGMRLDAARAGGIAYMIKPVNIGNLIDKLDGLTSTRPQVPYRVMIVDDSQALADNHSAVLWQAGMQRPGSGQSHTPTGCVCQHPYRISFCREGHRQATFCDGAGQRRFPDQADTTAASGIFSDQSHPAVSDVARLHGARQSDRLAEPYRYQRPAGS
jgi:CheY-like chemotaxis protein